MTFNYDTIIEHALRKELGISISGLPDYVRHAAYHLIKLHGSINWVHRVAHVEDVRTRTGESVAEELIKNAASLTVSERFEMGPPLNGETLAVGLSMGPDPWPFVPAMAIPIRSKKFECPPEHLEALYQSLPMVSRLLIIGWSATEEHFLKELKDRMSAHVYGQIVGADLEDAQRIATEIRKHETGYNLEASPKAGFTDFVLSGAADEFLSR